MKRRTKIGLSLTAVAFGAVMLSSCTQSFCSQVDVARMKFAFEPGITRITRTGTASDVIEFKDGTYTYTITGAVLESATWVYEDDPHVGNFYFDKDGENEQKLTYLNTILSDSRKAGYVTIDGYYSIDYLQRFDYLALNAIFGKAAEANEANVTINFTSTSGEESDKLFARVDRDLSYYSYLIFDEGNSGKAWKNWDLFNTEARKEITAGSVLEGKFTNTAALSPDVCPSTDFVKLYKSKVSSYVANYRTCLTTKTDKYGSYGYSTNGVFIESKSWGTAWSKGLFEGLLVYPIGWLVDTIVIGFNNAGVQAGVSAFLGIVFVTFIIRSLMLLATFKQTQSNAKMTELQPEIQKIQNKYPNANTSQAEKQRMAEEMNRLYKKNKINPFTTIIVMIIQFPVFICVWGALSGSAVLTNGTLLGLNLSMTIRDVLFTKIYWGPEGGYAAVTALILFLLMAGSQTIAMLLPQWFQKAKAKKVAKLGKNPAQKQQSNRMKIFTYVMLALIIFMGFSLASAMGIYWFIGAVFSIVQTLVMQAITERKAKKA